MDRSERTSAALKRPTLLRLKPLLGRLGLSYDEVINHLIDEHEARNPQPQQRPTGIDKVPVIGPIARGLKGLGKEASASSVASVPPSPRSVEA